MRGKERESPMRILIVEDDAELAEALSAAFARVSVHCDWAPNSADADQLIATTEYALVILDLGLPDEDGMVLLRRLRAKGRKLPIIVLTARGDSASRVNGLRGGADDFLVKPFLFDELHARVDAVLRRQGGYVAQVVTYGKLSFDLIIKEATVGGQRLALSVRELEVLEPLLRRAGHVVPKTLLEDQLFGAGDTLGSNAVEVYAHRLRKKLEKSDSGLVIETIRGVGYFLTET